MHDISIVVNHSLCTIHLLSKPERLEHVVDAEVPSQTMKSTLLQCFQ
jgi:hypothetical protein